MTVGSFQLPGTGGQKSSMYRLVELTAEAGAISVQANAVNSYIPGSGDSGTVLSVFMPPPIEGFARDCLLMIDQSDLTGSISVVYSGGEFESPGGSAPELSAGMVDVLSFTEIASGRFAVSHKALKDFS